MLHLASEFLIALTVSTFAAEPQTTKSLEPSVRVECHGRLRNGMVAIGGETTGTTVTCDHVKWELKFSDEASRTFAKDHDKKPITATGTLRRVAGKAVPVRWIMDVDRISERDANVRNEAAMVTVVGTLRSAVVATGEPSRQVIDAEGVIWPLDLSKDSAIKSKAESLATKMVVIAGKLECESKSPTRTIIRVEKLDAVTAADAPK